MANPPVRNDTDIEGFEAEISQNLLRAGPTDAIQPVFIRAIGLGKHDQDKWEMQ